MRKVLIIALLFFSCQQQANDKRSPYDLASQQQLSYLSKFMTFKDSLKLPTNKNGLFRINNNYQKWAIQYWKANPQINKWLLQVKEKNSDDTAISFTLVDYSIPVSFVSSEKNNSAIYNTIQAMDNNAYVIATGKINSSPSFENTNDTTLQRVYLDAVFDTIVAMKDSVQ
jgi:hypothetical protein